MQNPRDSYGSNGSGGVGPSGTYVPPGGNGTRSPPYDGTSFQGSSPIGSPTQGHQHPQTFYIESSSPLGSEHGYDGRSSRHSAAFSTSSTDGLYNGQRGPQNRGLADGARNGEHVWRASRGDWSYEPL